MHDYAIAAPEIFLAVAAMVLLMVVVFRGNSSTRALSWASVGCVVAALIFVVRVGALGVETFAGMFVVDELALYAKVLILIGSAVAIIMSLDFIRREEMERFEFPILLLLATLGMMMMVSANDLIALYLGLELQSLSLYVVAAFRRDSLRSTEAGLKYFVLGALSSGMLLYGCSLIYGFTGMTSFSGIAAAVEAQEGVSIGVIAGIVFLVAGLAFKVSAVPFHMWTPDVYEGAPTPITAFFAAAPKIAGLVLFVRAMVVPFDHITSEWQQIVVFLSVLSMVLGAFAAIAQDNIKRLMAYSSIGHVGYALVGLAAGTEEGVRGVLIYLTIYLAMNVGAFAVILSMRRRSGMVEEIPELAGLARNHPLMALAMAIFMFSLAGVPPLAGFFGKFYVFLAAINAELYALAVIGVLASVVSAYYYLRIVRLMYFDEPAEPYDAMPGMEMRVIMGVCAVFVTFFLIYPAPIVEQAQIAAHALMP